MSHFPIRHPTTRPPPSGGFYDYPRLSRTVGKLELQDEPSTRMVLPFDMSPLPSPRTRLGVWDDVSQASERKTNYDKAMKRVKGIKLKRNIVKLNHINATLSSGSSLPRLRLAVQFHIFPPRLPFKKKEIEVSSRISIADQRTGTTTESCGSSQSRGGGTGISRGREASPMTANSSADRVQSRRTNSRGTSKSTGRRSPSSRSRSPGFESDHPLFAVLGEFRPPGPFTDGEETTTTWRPPVETADVEVQTEAVYHGRDLDDLVHYKKWSKDELEPFLKDLKRALVTRKPKDIPSYIIGYCEALLMGREVPECTEDPTDKPPPPELYGGKDWSGHHNNITVSNSVIRLPGFDSSRSEITDNISNTESMESNLGVSVGFIIPGDPGTGSLPVFHHSSLTPINASRAASSFVDTLEISN